LRAAFILSSSLVGLSCVDCGRILDDDVTAIGLFTMVFLLVATLLTEAVLFGTLLTRLAETAVEWTIFVGVIRTIGDVSVRLDFAIGLIVATSCGFGAILLTVGKGLPIELVTLVADFKLVADFVEATTIGLVVVMLADGVVTETEVFTETAEADCSVVVLVATGSFEAATSGTVETVVIGALEAVVIDDVETTAIDGLETTVTEGVETVAIDEVEVAEPRDSETATTGGLGVGFGVDAASASVVKDGGDFKDGEGVDTLLTGFFSEGLVAVRDTPNSLAFSRFSLSYS
jgi:hypothetical protein